MADKRKTIILLHGNSAFTDTSLIQKGELVIEHGVGAENVKLHTLDDNGALATFASEAAVDAKVAEAEKNFGEAIEALDLAQVGAEGKFIQSVKQTDGKVEAVAADLNAAAVAFEATEGYLSAQTTVQGALAEVDVQLGELATDLDELAKDLEDASKAATTVVAVKEGEVFLKMEEATAEDGHKTYTLHTEDVASATATTEAIATAQAAATTVVMGEEYAEDFAGAKVLVNGVAAEDGHMDYTVSLENVAAADVLDETNRKLGVLIGDDAEKSVRTIANEELARVLLEDAEQGAEDNFQTLKELADWLEKHPEDAAAMNSQIAALEAILAGYGVEEGKTATVKTDVEAINRALDTLNGDENTAGSVAKAVKDAKDAIDAYTVNGYEISTSPVLAASDLAVTEIKDGETVMVSADTVQGAFEQVVATIVENEKTHAGAYNDLNDRLLDLEADAVMSVEFVGADGVTVAEDADNKVTVDFSEMVFNCGTY